MLHKYPTSSIVMRHAKKMILVKSMEVFYGLHTVPYFCHLFSMQN